MDWQKTVVRRTLECAGEYPGVQLQFLLQRLEKHPEALPAIAEARRQITRLMHRYGLTREAAVAVAALAFGGVTE